MFEKFKNRLEIRGTIVTTTAMHIGAAEQDFTPNSKVNLCLKNPNGLPFIPGSSLKGVLRSFLGSLLKSEIGKKYGNGECCTITRMCLSKGTNDYDEYSKLSKDRSTGSDKKLAEYVEKKICMTCRIFGSGANAAKLLIRDAVVNEQTFSRDYEIRSSVKINRELGVNANQMFFTTEVVPQGTEFELFAVAENIKSDEWECIRALFLALEMEMIQIGGMTSRGLGGVKLKNIEVSYLDANNIFDAIFKQELPNKIGLNDFTISKEGFVCLVN